MTAAVVAVLVPAAFGCGGGDGSDSLSKAEFTKQVDAVCARALKPLASLSSEERTVVLKAQETFFATQISGLANIDAPDELSTAFADYKASLKTRRAIVHETYEAARSAGVDSSEAQSLEAKQGRAFAAAGRLTQQLGTQSCR